LRYHSTDRMNEETGILDLTMTALAHPTRRAILQRVMRRESRVTELAEPFAISLNAVSKHISVLERAGLVRRRRAWREHWVSFNPVPLDEAAAWIEKTRSFWTARLDALDALLKAEDAAASPQSQRKGRRT
jgi:DNA-binding transcriptional ArsR family regulator